VRIEKIGEKKTDKLGRGFSPEIFGEENITKRTKKVHEKCHRGDFEGIKFTYRDGQSL